MLNVLSLVFTVGIQEMSVLYHFILTVAPNPLKQKAQ